MKIAGATEQTTTHELKIAEIFLNQAITDIFSKIDTDYKNETLLSLRNNKNL